MNRLPFVFTVESPSSLSTEVGDQEARIVAVAMGTRQRSWLPRPMSLMSDCEVSNLAK